MRGSAIAASLALSVMALSAAPVFSQTAADQAKQVTSEARTQMASLSSQAKDHASSVMSSTSDELHQQMGERLGRASTMARERAGQLQALAEGRIDDAGPLKDWADEASQRLRRLADKADELGPRGIIDELSDFARRRPAAFLAGAGIAGIFVGRLARAGKEISGSNSSQSEPVADLPAQASPYSAQLAGTAGAPFTGAAITEDPIGATAASPQTTTPGTGTVPGGTS